jgi:hypothetical protein
MAEIVALNACLYFLKILARWSIARLDSPCRAPISVSVSSLSIVLLSSASAAALSSVMSELWKGTKEAPSILVESLGA